MLTTLRESRMSEQAVHHGKASCDHRLQRVSRRRKKGRYAVLLLKSQPEWRPASLTSMPRSIQSATFLARNLKCTEACIVAQSFNACHFDAGEFTGEWAVVVSALFGWQACNDVPPLRSQAVVG